MLRLTLGDLEDFLCSKSKVDRVVAIDDIHVKRSKARPGSLQREGEVLVDENLRDRELVDLISNRTRSQAASVLKSFAEISSPTMSSSSSPPLASLLLIKRISSHMLDQRR